MSWAVLLNLVMCVAAGVAIPWAWRLDRRDRLQEKENEMKARSQKNV